MRIILVQAEIELAIRNFVFSQISIAEGQDISIDFKNTRGDDGATAEINITTPGTATTPVKPTSSVFTRREASTGQGTATEAPQAEKTDLAEDQPVDPTKAAPAPAAEAGATSPTEAETSVEPASTTTGQTASSEEDDGEIKRTVPFDADQPVDQEVVTEPVKPAVAAKSLFANLKRPVNTPAS